MEIALFGLTLNTDSITPKQKLIGGGIITAAILGLGVYYWLLPVYDEWSKLKEEVVGLENTRAEKLVKVKNIENVRKEYNNLLVKLAKIERKIPKQENIPSLLIDLERLTGINGVNLIKFVPAALQPLELPAHLKSTGGTQAEQNLRQLPVSINLKADYPTLMNMFSSFEGYERTINVTGVSLTPATKSIPTQYKALDVSFNLKAFVLLGGVR